MSNKYLDQQGLSVLWERIKEQDDKIVIRGYFLNDNFWTDSTYTVPLEKNNVRLYIDNNSGLIYQYNGAKYVSTNDVLPKASSDLEGIMKLYKSKGSKEDGTMTQKAITNELNTKVEAKVEGETAIFSITM